MTTDNFAHRAADWDQPSKIEMTRIFVEELLQNLEPDINWKGLEIGAGTGLVGLQVLPHIGSIVFEDTSPAMLDVLRFKLQEKENAEIVEGEIFDYKKQDIDFAFSLMAFHHIPEIDKALAHLHSIMKPGGIVAVGDLLSEDGSFHHFEPIPHKGFDLKTLTTQFQEAGFEVKSAHIYNTLQRERIPGVIGDYEQFIIIASRL